MEQDNILVVKENLSAADRQNTRKHIQQRAFSATGRSKQRNKFAIFKHGGSQTVNFDPYYIYLFVDGGGVVRDGLSYLAVGYVVKHGGLIKIV